MKTVTKHVSPDELKQMEVLYFDNHDIVGSMVEAFGIPAKADRQSIGFVKEGTVVWTEPTPEVKVVDLLDDDAIPQIVANNAAMKAASVEVVPQAGDEPYDNENLFVLSMLESTWDGKTGEIIAIVLNDGKGYHTTTYGRQTREWIDYMNERLGVTPAKRWAYEMCSLFGHWENYVRTLSMCEEKFAELASKKAGVS